MNLGLLVVVGYFLAKGVESGAIESGAGYLQGTVDIIYERSQDAIAAVNLLGGQITFFKKTWALVHEDGDSS